MYVFSFSDIYYGIISMLHYIERHVEFYRLNVIYNLLTLYPVTQDGSFGLSNTYNMFTEYSVLKLPDMCRITK